MGNSDRDTDRPPPPGDGVGNGGRGLRHPVTRRILPPFGSVEATPEKTDRMPLDKWRGSHAVSGRSARSRRDLTPQPRAGTGLTSETSLTAHSGHSSADATFPRRDTRWFPSLQFEDRARLHRGAMACPRRSSCPHPKSNGHLEYHTPYGINARCPNASEGSSLSR